MIRHRGSGLIDAAALVLAGGRGKRAGGGKLFLSLDGKFLMERVLSRLPAVFPQVILSCREDDVVPFSEIFGSFAADGKIHILTDRRDEVGPLEGLSQGLHYTSYPWVFVLGCDMPLMQDAVVRLMWSKRKAGSDAVVARLAGFIEPLHAFYSKRCAKAVDDAISRSDRKISSFLSDISPVFLEEGDMEHIPGFKRSFLNINTAYDMKRWLEDSSGRY